MARKYDEPPVRGKGSSTICDMVTHAWCVHYGGCFEGSEKGVYDTKKLGVLWGEESMGKNDELFGPPYGRYRQCDRDTWSVVHNICDWKGPLRFIKTHGALVKFCQSNIKGRTSKLGPDHLPLPEDTVASSTPLATPSDNDHDATTTHDTVFQPTHPGGLILAASFSYMQDPREVHRKNPRPWIFPAF